MAGYCTSVRPYFHEPQGVKIQHSSAISNDIAFSHIKLINNAFFIRNESLFVSAAATSAFQLKHTPRLLRSISVPCKLSYVDHRI